MARARARARGRVTRSAVEGGPRSAAMNILLLGMLSFLLLPESVPMGGGGGGVSELCAATEADGGPRASCGFANQPDECVAAGCCWDPVTPNPTAKPWCFRPQSSRSGVAGGSVGDSEHSVSTFRYADDAAAQCWLNASVTSCPNPLAGLPRLPKPHYSWPFNDVTQNFSQSPVIRDYARITQSVPIDLNFKLYGKPSCQPASDPQGGAVIFKQHIREAVKLCAQKDVNCSLAGNYSPFRACEAGCRDFWKNCTTSATCEWPVNLQWEVGCYTSILKIADEVVKQANKELGSSVSFGSVLFDQEYFGVPFTYNATTNQYLSQATPAYIAAVNRGNDAVYNATLAVWPDVAVDQYKRGEVSRAAGDCASPTCTASWDSSAMGPWCGMPNSGEGNEDVRPCSNTEYSLSGQHMQSFSCEIYTVGELQTQREAFNRTVNSAKAHGLSRVTPWIWLGGGSRRVVASIAGRYNDEKWNYEMIYSWMLGLEINQPYYGRFPARFSQWGAAERVAFYPSMFSNIDIVQTPCGNCSVRLQHFIAYVHGAANMTSLAGPDPFSNYALHACECIMQTDSGSTQRVLVHDVVRAHDVCNASYHDACPPAATRPNENGIGDSIGYKRTLSTQRVLG
eukprot:COSAG06_NODE_349_length_16992_cov_9.318712_12_plen_624_part_00